MARQFLVLIFFAIGARAWAPEAELAAPTARPSPRRSARGEGQRELHRSIAASAPRPAGGAAAAAGVAGAVLAASPHALIVFQNALYVFDDHRDAKKHKPHYLFDAPVDPRAPPLPDVVAAWDAGATGQRCEKLPAPCLAIAKQAGFAARRPGAESVLCARRRVGEAGARRGEKRSPRGPRATSRVFWRGSVKPGLQPGNVARLAALTFTAARDDLFDVRATSLDAPDPNTCAGFTAAMRALAAHSGAVRGAFVNASGLRSLAPRLNLPGTMGRVDRATPNRLWPMRASCTSGTRPRSSGTTRD